MRRLSGITGISNLTAFLGSGLRVAEQLFPSISEGVRRLAEWTNQVQEKHNMFSTEDKVERDLSKDTMDRQRFRPHLKGVFKDLPMQMQIPWSVYWELLAPSDRRYLWNIIGVTGIFSATNGTWILTKLKDLSALAKKFQTDVFGERWKLLIDLHLLRDYVPAKQITDFKQDIEDWVVGDIPHEFEGEPGKFLEYLRLGVRRFFKDAPCRHEPNPLTVPQWLSDPQNWARSGTSDGSRLEVVTKGKRHRARKSKWATALSSSLDKLLRVFWSTAKQTNGAVQKRELGKVRAVLSGDNSNYLRMSFVSYWMEAMLAGHPHTTLYYDSLQQLTLWYQMARGTENSLIKLPLDEEEYDHRVTMPMLHVALDEVSNFIQDKCTNGMATELLNTVASIKRSITGGTVTVGGYTVKVQKGVLSGWRWTAFIDTILNVGKLEAYRAIIYERTMSNPLNDYVSQGDDVRMEIANASGAGALYQCYIETGFKVNAQKFFAKTDCDEFLRQVAQPGLTAGYPARAIASLVFRNPVTRELAKGEERMREQVSSWNTVMSRIGYDRPDQMKTDLARANNLDVDIVNRYLSTPACVGGVGYESTKAETVMGIGIGKSHREIKWHYSSTPALAGLMAQYFGKPTDYADKWRSAVDVKSEDEWSLFEVKEVEIPWPTNKVAVQGKYSPIHAQRRRDIPSSVSEVMLDYILRSRPFDTDLVLRWLAPEHIPFFTRLYHSASLRVTKAWLSGSLPFATPVIPGWSPLAVSQVYNGYSGSMWSWATQHRRCGWARVLRAAYTTERVTRDVLKIEIPRIGG